MRSDERADNKCSEKGLILPVYNPYFLYGRFLVDIPESDGLVIRTGGYDRCTTQAPTSDSRLMSIHGEHTGHSCPDQTAPLSNTMNPCLAAPMGAA